MNTTLAVKEDPNTNATAVTIDDTCYYWIGPHALKWSEASQYCKKLNATLVVLDSATTINHVTHLMIDNNKRT